MRMTETTTNTILALRKKNERKKKTHAVAESCVERTRTLVVIHTGCDGFRQVQGSNAKLKTTHKGPRDGVGFGGIISRRGEMRLCHTPRNKRACVHEEYSIHTPSDTCGGARKADIR